MQPEGAIRKAKELGRLGRFSLSRHAIERIGERSVSRMDIAVPFVWLIQQLFNRLSEGVSAYGVSLVRMRMTTR